MPETAALTNGIVLRIFLKWLLGVAFAAAGLNHFWHTDFYVGIMPDYLPQPLLLVWISGVIETACGVALLVPRLERTAVWGIIATSIAVFPANINMALHAERFSQFSPTALWLRLPLQGVIIAWAWHFTRSARPSRRD